MVTSVSTSESLRTPRQTNRAGGLAPFVVWLIVFYGSWLTLVAVGDLGRRAADHWPIAASMAAGSYFAGSTPMGGGAVGFPVLVLVFDQPAAMGRVFAFAIQSIGMVSASIFILSTRTRVDWRLLRPALWASLVATPLGVAFAAPVVPDLAVKLLFAVIWASFGVVHLRRLREMSAPRGLEMISYGSEHHAGLAVGAIGGVVASLTGVGIDMVIYAAMVFLYRADMKVAIPTSVILMAFTSVVGLVSSVALHYTGRAAYFIPGDVFDNWLAAAPVVAVGAPFGAMAVRLIPRTLTLGIVSLLCLVQFAWTLRHEHVSPAGILGCITAVLALNYAFDWLYAWSRNAPEAAGLSRVLCSNPVKP